MSTDPVAQAASTWWLFLILGLVSVIAGILAIVYPDITLLALGLFAGISLGFWLIVEGVVRFIRAFSELEDRALRHGEPGAAAIA